MNNVQNEERKVNMEAKYKVQVYLNALVELNRLKAQSAEYARLRCIEELTALLEKLKVL